jgi:hypothetical protein
MHGERRTSNLKTKVFLQSAEIKLILLITTDLFVPTTNVLERPPSPKTASGQRNRRGQPKRNPVTSFLKHIYLLIRKLSASPVFKDYGTRKDIRVDRTWARVQVGTDFIGLKVIVYVEKLNRVF